MRARRAEPGDEATIRWLRIEALTEDDRPFGSTLERERARTDADWRRWIDPGPTFLLEAPDGTAVGLACGRPDPDHDDRAFLLALWVAPAARGEGGGQLLCQRVIDWATAAGRATVLHVTEGNGPALRLYERLGFTLTGDSYERDKDGARELELLRPLPH